MRESDEPCAFCHKWQGYLDSSVNKSIAFEVPFSSTGTVITDDDATVMENEFAPE
jgi:hypothetical protein